MRAALASAVATLAAFGSAGTAAAVPSPDPAPDHAPASVAAPAPAPPTPQIKPDSPKPKKPKKPKHPPLKVTPPLGVSHFVFPVVGPVSWGDSYGVARPDVPNRWHHGDDIFAPLGAAIVAVADGRIERVGWERLGGWRLWLYDAAGDGFYYAHLSGYTHLALHTTYVKAGQVLGFVGNTGDADGGETHLHFEIHPASLNYLGEDGAVDPTGYLAGWQHIGHVYARSPVLPSLPAGAAGESAQRIYSALLAVRLRLKVRVRRQAPVAAVWPSRILFRTVSSTIPFLAAAEGTTPQWTLLFRRPFSLHSFTGGLPRRAE